MEIDSALHDEVHDGAEQSPLDDAPATDANADYSEDNVTSQDSEAATTEESAPNGAAPTSSSDALEEPGSAAGEGEAEGDDEYEIQDADDVSAEAEPEEMYIDYTATGTVTDGPVYIGNNCLSTPTAMDDRSPQDDKEHQMDDTLKDQGQEGIEGTEAQDESPDQSISSATLLEDGVGDGDGDGQMVQDDESSTMDKDMGGCKGVASSDDVNDIRSAAQDALSTGISMNMSMPETSSASPSLREVVLAAAVCGFILFFVSNNGRTLLFSNNQIMPWERKLVDQFESENLSIIQTEGCNIPFLNTSEDFVRSLEKQTEKNIEPCKRYSLLSSNRTHIWIEKRNYPHYNISISDNLTCCYISFYRPKSVLNVMSNSVDSRVEYNNCSYFTGTIRARDEFVKVTCTIANDKKIRYESYFVFAVKKSLVTKSHTNLPYNVLILGIDGVSRMNLHRTMPKTVAKLINLGAIELLGYNKVGDNSFPNLIPLLMGLKDSELEKTCLPNRTATFDNCPFVWNRFQQAGFATAFVEDSSTLGTFNYLKRGFMGFPTDYYLHTFTHQVESYAKQRNGSSLTKRPCMNEKFIFKIYLDYLKDLTITVNRKLFTFFWEITMSHNYLYYPTLMDDSYSELFENMYVSGYLNETIIFLISDHGIRFGNFRATKAGHLEERLPFVLALTPPSFRNKFSEAYDNLKLNSGRLTTPYDMHATLSDLVDLGSIENTKIIERSKDNYWNSRSISLFLPIPSNRTCKIAKIDDHWCTCHRHVKASKDSKEARQASNYIVWHLNNLLKNWQKCAKLSIVKVLHVARVLSGTRANSEKEPTLKLSVVLLASPGAGVFEGTAELANGRWALKGPVSRLNLYGNQSHCVPSPLLKLYCFCINIP